MSKLTRLLSATSLALALSAITAHAAPILVAMKGPGAGNPFWAAVEKGATEKAAELGQEVVVLSPPTETDVNRQIALIEDQMAKGVSGLVLAPLDPNAIKPLVDQAIAEKIPVVFIDTKGLNENVTFIGTDNLMGAKLAADYICKTVPKGSDVAVLTGVVTQSTGKDRADGSIAGLQECGMNIVSTQSGEWDRAKGLAVTENIITGNPNVKAIFGSSDSMALGAIEALKTASMLGDVKIVGFDANPEAAASIIKGDMAASVAQNPYNMGALGIESITKLIKGETLPAVIDTGTVLVTKENAEQFK